MRQDSGTAANPPNRDSLATRVAVPEKF